MGQFDSRTDAAQTQLDSDERELGLLRRVPSGFLDIAALLLELVNGGETGSVLKGALAGLKLLAGQRAEENVRYLLDAVAADLRDLIDEFREQKEKIASIEDAVKGPRFSELLTEAAMQATRTASRRRIERLAHVVVSGAVTYPSVGMDVAFDFERHCVELTDADVLLLGFLADRQPPAGRGGYFDSGAWAEQIRLGWLNLPRTSGGGYMGVSEIDARSSFVRLQSRGLVCQLSWGHISAGNGSDPYAVLDEGRTFLKFLKESSTKG